VGIAFFDVDNTVVHGITGRMFATFLLLKGEIGLKSYMHMPYYSLFHYLGLLEYEKVVELGLKTWRGRSSTRLRELGFECFAKRIKPRIYPGARTLIRQVRESNLMVVLLSASPSQIIEPLAEEIAADAILTTKIEVENDRFTGRLTSPPCYGKAKTAAAKDFAAQKGFEINQCWAYADSQADIPLLSACGKAVAVNPDRWLLNEAKRNKWEVIRFKL